MIQCVRIFTRPDPTINWHTEQPFWTIDFAEHMHLTYVLTDKCIDQYNVVSEDELSMTYTAIWATQADYDEYDVDSVLELFWASRDDYYNSMSVIMGPVTMSVI